jgi:DNA (cytosine-5)-methyltransferase 1
MRLLDLFAGIGGFSLAAHWMGWTTEAFVERDKFCQAVLRKNFGQGIEIHDDITTFSGKPFCGRVDIVCGGFPCQPYSLAGQRKGKDDLRHLWPEMLRTVKEVRSRFVVAENVFGLVNWSGGMVFNDVQTDLENAGYAVVPYLLPACAIGAQTRRDRVWIIGQLSDTSGVRCGQPQVISERQQFDRGRTPQRLVDPLYRDASRHYWRNESGFVGVLDGLSDGVDRLRSIGNSIVPQVAYEIFRAIQDAENEQVEVMSRS